MRCIQTCEVHVLAENRWRGGTGQSDEWVFKHVNFTYFLETEMIRWGVFKHVKLTYFKFSYYLKTDEKDDQMRGIKTCEVHVLAEDGDGIRCSDEDVQTCEVHLLPEDG